MSLNPALPRKRAARPARPARAAASTLSEDLPYHHGDLRNALIQAGRIALEEVGARELSLRHVARSVGVSEAAPSRHFDGKEGLLAAMATEGFRELAQQRLAVRAASAPMRDKARRMMDQYVGFAQVHKGMFDLMVGPRILQRDAHPELVQAAAGSFDLFAQTVCDYARECGWPDNLLNLVVHAGWSVEHGLASLILGNRAPSLDWRVDIGEMVEFSISLFLSAVAAGPASLVRLGGEPAAAGISR